MKPGRKKKSLEKHMLDNLIKKYKENDIEQVVYRLTYAGKFIIIKGKTLAGSCCRCPCFYHPKMQLSECRIQPLIYF